MLPRKNKPLADVLKNVIFDYLAHEKKYYLFSALCIRRADAGIEKWSSKKISKEDDGNIKDILLTTPYTSLFASSQAGFNRAVNLLNLIINMQDSEEELLNVFCKIFMSDKELPNGLGNSKKLREELCFGLSDYFGLCYDPLTDASFLKSPKDIVIDKVRAEIESRHKLNNGIEENAMPLHRLG